MIFSLGFAGAGNTSFFDSGHSSSTERATSARLPLMGRGLYRGLAAERCLVDFGSDMRLVRDVLLIGEGSAYPGRCHLRWNVRSPLPSLICSGGRHSSSATELSLERDDLKVTSLAAAMRPGHSPSRKRRPVPVDIEAPMSGPSLVRSKGRHLSPAAQRLMALFKS